MKIVFLIGIANINLLNWNYSIYFSLNVHSGKHDFLNLCIVHALGYCVKVLSSSWYCDWLLKRPRFANANVTCICCIKVDLNCESGSLRNAGKLQESLSTPYLKYCAVEWQFAISRQLSNSLKDTTTYHLTSILHNISLLKSHLTNCTIH